MKKTANKRSSPVKRRWQRAVLGCLALLLVTVLGYAAYVLLTYYRLEDALPLEILSAPSAGSVEVTTGKTYRAVSYNIGFGAYSDDYTFFMDGGTESRARSAAAVYENVGGAVGEIQAQDPDFVLLRDNACAGRPGGYLLQHLCAELRQPLSLLAAAGAPRREPIRAIDALPLSDHLCSAPQPAHRGEPDEISGPGPVLFRPADRCG